MSGAASKRVPSGRRVKACQRYRLGRPITRGQNPVGDPCPSEPPADEADVIAAVKYAYPAALFSHLIPPTVTRITRKVSLREMFPSSTRMEWDSLVPRAAARWVASAARMSSRAWPASIPSPAGSVITVLSASALPAMIVAPAPAMTRL